MSQVRFVSVAIALTLLAGCASAGADLGLPASQPQRPFTPAKFTKSHHRAYPVIDTSFLHPMTGSAGRSIYVAYTNGSAGGHDTVQQLTFDPVTQAQPTPGRTITTGISNPRALDTDGSNDLFVANGGTDSVKEYYPGQTTPCGTITGLANPTTVAVQNGELWVGTKDDDAVSEYNEPCSGDPNPNQPIARFTNIQNPQAIAFLGNGYVTVADSATSTVASYLMSGPNAGKLFRVINAATGAINNPQAIAFDLPSTDLFPNYLWVANFGNGTVTRYAPGASTYSAITPAFGDSTASIASMGQPISLAIEDGGGYVWVANHGTGSVDRIDATTGLVSWVYQGLPGSPFTNVNAIVEVPYPGLPGHDYFIASGPGYVEAIDGLFGSGPPPCPAAVRRPAECPRYARGYTPFSLGAGTNGVVLALGP